MGQVCKDLGLNAGPSAKVKAGNLTSDDSDQKETMSMVIEYVCYCWKHLH